MAFSDTESQTPSVCLIQTNLAIREIGLISAQLHPVVRLIPKMLPELSLLAKREGGDQFVTDIPMAHRFSTCFTISFLCGSLSPYSAPLSTVCNPIQLLMPENPPSNS